jgi:hypothetical protein
MLPLNGYSFKGLKIFLCINITDSTNTHEEKPTIIMKHKLLKNNYTAVDL